jgi:WD40 repeat protein
MSDEQSPDEHATVPPSPDGERGEAGAKRVSDAGSASASAPGGTGNLLGSDLGGIRIVRLIAEGGMGQVYEGRQERPRRTVAVKVMRPGVTSGSALKRFEFESQVLARLRHPGIAQIHAVGVHDGRGGSTPYFVMEYIPNAKPITQYAEDLKLTTRARLELFGKVCEAVAHGHQKGVIHRDLKPGNILVDASGQPKVIDFGVARTTDSDMALTTMQTDVGALIGTLQYMSPEQFDADPTDLDVRLDVYALGVVMYELLAGHPPYDVRRKAIYEVARVVREEEPTPLSSLNRTLRRDVALIAGKCLQKDRTRRYSSASDLGADVIRYLTGEPIMAESPGFFGAVSRLARRHRVAATVTGVVAVSLLAAVVGISAFAVRAERSRAAEYEARGLAERERAAAETARTQADKAATEARRELYFANLFRLSELIRTGSLRAARELFAATTALLEDGAPLRDDQLPLELRILRAELDQAIAVLPVTGGGSVRWSPDGTLLAHGSNEGGVTLWRLKEIRAAIRDGRQPEPVGTAKGGSLIEFSPDGSRLATADSDAIRILDAGTLQEVATLAVENPGAFCFSHDGRRLAIGMHDGTARIWDVDVGRQVATAAGHDSRVFRIAFVRDDTELVTAGFLAGTKKLGVRVWNVVTGEPILAGDLAGNMLDVSPDGRRLATVIGTEDGRVWDVTRRIEKFRFTGGGGRILESQFSPDGRLLATTSTNASLDLWNIDSQERLQTGVWNMGSISWSRDCTSLAGGASDLAVRYWRVGTRAAPAVFRGHTHTASPSTSIDPTNTLIASFSLDGTVRLWPTGIGTLTEAPAIDAGGGEVASIVASPDGGRVATISTTGIVQMWHADSGEWLGHLAVNGEPEPMVTFTFGPQARSIATVSQSGAVRIWDAGILRPLNLLEGKADVGQADRQAPPLIFDASGTRIGALLADGSARVWEIRTGRVVATIGAGDSPIGAVRFTADGEQLLTLSTNGENGLWALPAGNLVAHGDATRDSREIAVSGDGRLVAALLQDGSTVGIWAAPATGVPRWRLAHTGSARRLRFIPGGRHIAALVDQSLLHVWDLTTGSLTAVLGGRAEHITDFIASPTGSHLALLGSNGTVRLWALENATWLGYTAFPAGLLRSPAFHPDGRRLYAASRTAWDRNFTGSIVKIVGQTPAEQFAARERASVVRAGIKPLVEGWQRLDIDTLRQRLAAARDTFNDEQYKAILDFLVIEAANTRHSPQSPPTVPP